MIVPTGVQRVTDCQALPSAPVRPIVPRTTRAMYDQPGDGVHGVGGLHHTGQRLTDAEVHRAGEDRDEKDESVLTGGR